MICGDTPAVTHALGLKGHTAKLPCRFCGIEGIAKTSEVIGNPNAESSLGRGKVTYYPILRVPKDTPKAARSEARNRRIRSPADLHSLHRRAEDLVDFIGDMDRLITKQAKDLHATNCGIARPTCLWDLRTVRHTFPFIAPEESMHTIMLNFIPQLISLSCGKYFEDISIISDATFSIMGQSIVSSQQYFPTEFGERIPDIHLCASEYQASTWYTYALLIMPIQYLHRLPESDKNIWSKFFWVMQVIHGHRMRKDLVDTVEKYLWEFMQYLER